MMTDLMVEGQPRIHKSQERFDEFEFFLLLNFLQHEDIIHGGGVKGSSFHIENGVRFLI